jgi:hypothetical protein
MHLSFSKFGGADLNRCYVIIVGAKDGALITNKLFAGFTEIDKGTFVMDAISK